jgi:glycosyltransferase involved in cell wall biosynthesis
MIPLMLKLSKLSDIVHLNSVKLAFPAFCASVAGARTILHLHELPARFGILLKAAIKRVDCAAFCSQTCSDHFAHIAARSRKILVNAVPLAEISTRSALTPVPKIVMLGSINHGKGQDLLLEAFAMVNGSAELHFYGNVGLSARGYVAELKVRAAGHPYAGKVFFHPPTDDVAGVLAETALLVHTSRQESFGMVLVEAMAAGVPVIANDLGGMREVVADGETGYLVEPCNPGLLAKKIDCLLADPDLRERMGIAGRERVRQRFDIATRIEDYHQLYEELADAGV